MSKPNNQNHGRNSGAPAQMGAIGGELSKPLIPDQVSGETQQQQRFEDDMDKFVGGVSAEVPRAPAEQSTVSRAEYEALQVQLAALTKLIASKPDAEIPEVRIPPHILAAKWLMNTEGVKFPATPQLRHFHKKLGLVPCEAPAGYDQKHKR